MALGGHSFGGLLTYHVAAEHPERVERAIVLDAPAEVDPAILEQIAPSLARLERTFDSWDEYDAFVRSFPYWEGFDWDEEIQAYYRGDAEELPDGRSGALPPGAHQGGDRGQSSRSTGRRRSRASRARPCSSGRPGLSARRGGADPHRRGRAPDARPPA